MPFYLYTFRPQINEQNLFEDFLSLFLPFLEEFPKYSYSIEEDGTLNKHIHIIYECTATDNTKAMPQKLNRKLFTSFRTAIKTKMTNESGFDDRMVKSEKEDYLKVLGYVNKATTNCWRRKSKGLSNEEIKEATDFYYASDRIMKSQINTDLKIMNSKNIHITIKEYCTQNDLEPTHPITKLHMIKDGNMFSQVSKVDETFEEVEINMFPERFPNEPGKPDKSYINLLQTKSDNEMLRVQINSLKKHFKIQSIKSSYFDNSVSIHYGGSDADWIKI